MSSSLLLLLKKKKKESLYEPRKRYCFSSVFRERDSRHSETRTNVSHPFSSVSCWRVRGHLWRIFRLMMCQMFSIGERSGLQVGQFSTRTLLLRSHAVVVAAVCGFALSCWNRRCLEGSICCSKMLLFIYLSAFIVPSKTCKLPIPYALMHPHTIRDAGFWTERWLNSSQPKTSRTIMGTTKKRHHNRTQTNLNYKKHSTYEKKKKTILHFHLHLCI